MLSSIILAALLPALALAQNTWYVDLFENGCDPNNAGGGTMTLAGNDTLHTDMCSGGPLFPDGGFNARAVKVTGISGSGLVVDLYAEMSCSKDSLITTIAGDNCYTSDEGDPVNFAIVHAA